MNNFDSIGSSDVVDVSKYYKQIKYVVNLSHFESCSNVMVESVFGGCVYVDRKKIQNDLAISSVGYSNLSNIDQLLDNTRTILPNNNLSIKKNNVIFVAVYRGIKHLRSLLQISNLINNELVDVSILLFVGTEYYKENHKNLINILDRQKHLYTTYLDNQNNFDKENVKKIIQLNEEINKLKNENDKLIKENEYLRSYFKKYN